MCSSRFGPCVCSTCRGRAARQRAPRGAGRRPSGRRAAGPRMRSAPGAAAAHLDVREADQAKRVGLAEHVLNLQRGRRAGGGERAARGVRAPRRAEQHRHPGVDLAQVSAQQCKRLARRRGQQGCLARRRQHKVQGGRRRRVAPGSRDDLARPRPGFQPGFDRRRATGGELREWGGRRTYSSRPLGLSASSSPHTPSGQPNGEVTTCAPARQAVTLAWARAGPGRSLLCCKRRACLIVCR